MIDFEEEAEHFLISCHGVRVIQVTLDHRLTLDCEDGAGHTLVVVLENEFTLRLAEREMLIRPGERDGDAGLAASELFQEEILRCVIVKAEGSLRMDLASGSMIHVTSGKMYEAWDIEGPGFKLIGVAGHVDFFDPRSSMTVIWEDGSFKPVTPNQGDDP